MPKTPKAYRLAEDVVNLIDTLTTRCTPNFTHSQAAVIEIAVRELAARRGVTAAVSKPAKKKGGAK